MSKWTKTKEEPTLGFFEADKMGTFEPHDNALVVTLQIREFDMKRVMVDQGSGAKIMYLDLYKGLGLKPKDLDKYDIFWLDLMGKPWPLVDTAFCTPYDLGPRSPTMLKF